MEKVQIISTLTSTHFFKKQKTDFIQHVNAVMLYKNEPWPVRRKILSD